MNVRTEKQTQNIKYTDKKKLKETNEQNEPVKEVLL